MKDDITAAYKRRKADFATWLARQAESAAVFIDSEAHRSPEIRYFTGFVGDAVLVISVDGRSVLIPWDENLAKNTATADYVIPFTRFERQAIPAVSAALKKLAVVPGSRVEIPASTPYPEFLHFVDELSGYDILCKEKGAEMQVAEMRSVKDEFEIAFIRRAAEITDTIIDLIEAGVKDGTITTETDAALLIERECRKAGCEGTGFETLAAGPTRSFAIHSFPPYTAGAFPAQGLSILDFGVKYNGYTSDVTLTIAKGPLTEEQEKQLELVEKAYNSALKLYEKDLAVRTPAAKVTDIFTKAKRTMPHSLGHGIGLECHEEPFVRMKTSAENLFKPGMTVTLEPGLYSSEFGGCRLENDILITEDGCEQLTHSRIIRID